MHPFAVMVLLGALAPVEAPVTEATVYGDRARVVRTASVELKGATAVELPLLEESVDAASLRVEADGAVVERVELQRAAPEEFPQTEARRLLTELEQLDDQLQRTQGERDAVSAQLERLKALSPQRPPAEGQTPRPDLDPSGWAASLQFVGERAAALEQRVREQDQRLLELTRQRQQTAEKAQLLGSARMTSGWRVIAHLNGKGRAKVRLIYLVPRARWMPLYELQLDPDASAVQVSFYGLVSQETGDDWKDAALTLSTAVPATSMAYPKLLTWKIGVKDRFIPTPAPLMEQVRPPPPAPPLPQERSLASEAYQQTMAELNQRLAGSPGQGAQLAAMAEVERRNSMARAEASARQQQELERRRRNAGRGALGSNLGSATRGTAGAAPAAAPSIPGNEYVLDGVSVNDPGFGINAAPTARSFLGPAQPAPSAASDSYGVSESSPPSAQRMPSSLTGRHMPSQPTVGVGLMPPPGYQPPRLDPNSPAGRAGGHDLSFTSARREEVLSGEGGRKVPLFSERWPVKLERKLFPAIAPYAFLVAELTSPAKQVMPAAPAQLFVGQDPAGTAELKLINPGEKLTLPLGVDRAIKPIRNVELVQSEQGFFGKDDVGEYLVTIEVANPYQTALPVRIHDQWPLQGNDKAEVTLGKVEPAAVKKDEQKGLLEWALTLPAGGKTKVTFRYTLKRPKSWRMEQRQEVVR